MSRTAAIRVSTQRPVGMRGAVGAFVRVWGWRGLGAVLLTLSLVRWGAGAPGDLDPSFGMGGTVITDLSVFGGANALVQQPDGKLVAAGGSNGDFALARYRP